MKPTIGKVYYESGKKFQTTRSCRIKTNVLGYSISTWFCTLTPDGWLLVYARFAWDGASGGIDTKKTIRGSLAHDVLYRLMRRGLLPRTEQGNADLTLRNVMKQDKAWVSRAWAWFLAVSWFGGKHTDPENKNVEFIAP